MTDTATETEVVEDLDHTADDPVEPDPPVEADVEGDAEPDTFPRSVVEDLRKESAAYRTKAKDRDQLAAALWTARVEATGRLADPTDLPLPDDVDPLDADAVTTAIDELLTRKPHLATRRPSGFVGQGITTQNESTNLAGILRSRA